ncbi:hypothetical protein A33Q_2773 [Indibacter alkaliphilus LW1]|uniref:Uncharacterized protein n=1 Tax=Indibacter alkaliphilus (strain CCUG 57479 / KCTC 22604 / LW1) TaxID=1189612 RepID=S2DTI8_INDAL|nr:hypothetical protein A33Q_2773 [Indibacter alkaliphilus LW1]
MLSKLISSQGNHSGFPFALEIPGVVNCFQIDIFPRESQQEEYINAELDSCELLSN